VPEAIMINNASEIFLTGAFSRTVDFDPSSNKTNLISNGSRDVFVAKFNRSALLIPKFISEDNNTLRYPKPTRNEVNILSTQTIKRVILFDLQGKLLYTKTDINNTSIQFDLKENLKGGVYLIEIEFMDTSKSYRKLLKH
jgi:hypothetical protein